MALVQLAFLIRMLIIIQSEVRLHTRRSVHFHPIPFIRPSFLFYQGSGSETTVGSGHKTTKWFCLVVALFLVPTHLLITCLLYCNGKLGGA